MNKSVLLDIFAQARLRATRRDRLISQQRAVIANLKMEGVDVAETEKDVVGPVRRAGKGLR
jgi:hypothetical protein